MNKIKFVLVIAIVGTFLISNKNDFKSDFSLKSLITMNDAFAAEGEVGTYTCKQLVKDPCETTISVTANLAGLKDLLGNLGLEIGASIDLTDWTQLVSTGGTFMCVENITCNDIMTSYNL